MGSCAGRRCRLHLWELWRIGVRAIHTQGAVKQCRFNGHLSSVQKPCWLMIVGDYTTQSGWWFGTLFIFPYIGNVIIPTDELIFFRGVGIPPTRLGILIIQSENAEKNQPGFNGMIHGLILNTAHFRNRGKLEVPSTKNPGQLVRAKHRNIPTKYGLEHGTVTDHFRILKFPLTACPSENLLIPSPVHIKTCHPRSFSIIFSYLKK